MLPEVLGAPEDLPLEPVEHMSFAICSVIPSGVRCASARRLISEFMARWTLEKPNFDGGLLAQRTSFAPAARSRAAQFSWPFSIASESAVPKVVTLSTSAPASSSR